MDLETLFHPHTLAAPMRDVEKQPGAVLNETVLKSGLLPQPAWRSKDGTDQLRFERRMEIQGAANRPRLEGQDVSVSLPSGRNCNAATFPASPPCPARRTCGQARAATCPASSTTPAWSGRDGAWQGRRRMTTRGSSPCCEARSTGSDWRRARARAPAIRSARRPNPRIQTHCWRRRDDAGMHGGQEPHPPRLA
ncbi:hypothetical protein [Myxococcus sp. SDU36]|uniref:hypothetical protein n=1 Tax=Myxococcus sp. SDU36 TaxID=2831967 RepID=UPI002542A693|nr:hypothetical protein [Myxococcus sp. SDU36]